MFKKLLLKFVRKFYNPDLQYINTLIKDWQKKSVHFIVQIIFDGIMFYLFLYGIIFIIPGLSHYFFLGSSYWHIPIVVLFLGIILWFTEEQYKFLRKRKKKDYISLLEQIEKNTRR